MISVGIFALLFASAPAAPQPSAEDLGRVFERFCVQTKAERAAFDAAVGNAADLQKVSAPLFPSGLEFHRRWKIGGIGLSFTEAPPPAPRSCGVTANVRGGFDGQAVAVEVAKISATALQQSDDNHWIGMTKEGHTVLVNNRPNPNGFGDVEIIYLP